MADDNAKFKSVMAAWGGAPALLLADNLCRYFRNPILNSIARFLGSEEVGYTCPSCIVKEQEDLAELGRELTEAATVNVDIPGDPSPCVMCGNAMSDPYRLVNIDGRQGFICASEVMLTACELKWARLNREKIGNRLQYAMKLK
jgi:hypothetical protein